MPRVLPGPMTIALTVIAGTVMIGIDLTIVNIAIPQLSRGTGASLPVIQWVATGYTLALVTAVPATAWAISRFGARQVFLVAISLFTLGSALVAFSWSVETLIGFRILQGVGGGFVLPSAMTLALTSTPSTERGRIMAVLGLPVLVGPVLGPVIGGLLLDTFSWRWMFLINLPLGVVSVALGLRNLPQLPSGPVPRLDVRGFILLPPGMALLVLGTSFAKDSVLTPEVLLPVGAGLVLVTVFVRHALRAEAPLLDLRLLGRRPTGTGSVILLLFSGGFSASMILIPLYWQVARGESATTAGLFMAPAGLAAGIAIQFSGRLIDKVRPIRVVGTGLVVSFVAATALVLLLGGNAPAWQLVALWTVVGIGAGFTIMPTTTVATRTLEDSAIPSGSTLIGVISQVSGAVCIAAVSVLLATQLSSRLSGINDRGVGSLGALPPSELAALAPHIANSIQAALWFPVGLMGAAAVTALVGLRGVPAPDETLRPVIATSPPQP